MWMFFFPHKKHIGKVSIFFWHHLGTWSFEGFQVDRKHLKTNGAGTSRLLDSQHLVQVVRYVTWPVRLNMKKNSVVWLNNNKSGQIIATSHDRFPPNGGLVREIPLISGKSGLVKYYSCLGSGLRVATVALQGRYKLVHDNPRRKVHTGNHGLWDP